MLAIYGKYGDIIKIGDDITIFMDRGNRNFYKLAVKAPKHLKIQQSSAQDPIHSTTIESKKSEK